MTTFLETQPVERQFDLDERLRSYHGLAFRDWPDHMLADIATSAMSDSMRQSLLFLAAGHGKAYSAAGAHSNSRLSGDLFEKTYNYIRQYY